MANVNTSTVVEVEPREGLGKSSCRRLRRDGRIPGNVYGMSLKGFAVSVSPRRVEEVLRLESGRNTILTLSMAGASQSRKVMLREMQRDPVTEALVHIDFLRVDPDKKLEVRVPVRLIGVPIGVKNEDGVLDFVHREVEVSCLPASIPEHLDVDVSELHVGQHVAVGDLTLVESVEFLEDPETILAVVSAPRAEEVEAVAEEEAEPAEGAADDAKPEEGAATEDDKKES